MTTFKYVCAMLIVLFFLSTNFSLFAQESDGHVFAVSTWKIRFDQLEDYLSLFEKDYKPLVTQNEHIKSLRVFTHIWGPDWNVLVIREYENFEAIAKAEERDNEIYERAFPDKARRQEFFKKIGSYIMAHTDAIVREVPALRK